MIGADFFLRIAPLGLESSVIVTFAISASFAVESSMPEFSITLKDSLPSSTVTTSGSSSESTYALASNLFEI